MLTPAFRPRAALDLESLVVYIGEVLGSPQAARRVYTELMEAVDQLCATPGIGRPIIDDRLEVEYRCHLCGQYRIFYTASGDVLTVWRVIHARQDIDDYALIEWRDI